MRPALRRWSRATTRPRSRDSTKRPPATRCWRARRTLARESSLPRPRSTGDSWRPRASICSWRRRARPTDSEPHRLLGLIYWIDEQSGKSIEHLRRAIQLAPGDERARVLLSDVLTDDRRLAEAERELTQARDAGLRSGPDRLPPRAALRAPVAAAAGRDGVRGERVIRSGRRSGSLLSGMGQSAGQPGGLRWRGRPRTRSGSTSTPTARRHIGSSARSTFSRVGTRRRSLSSRLRPGSIRRMRGHTRQPGRSTCGSSNIRTRSPRCAGACRSTARLREARYGLGTALMRAGRRRRGTRGARRLRATAGRRRGGGPARVPARRAPPAGREGFARRRPPGCARSFRGRRTSRPAECPVTPRSRTRAAESPAPARGRRASVAAQRIEETAEGFVYLVDAYGALGNAEEASRQRALARASSRCRRRWSESGSWAGADRGRGQRSPRAPQTGRIARPRF